MDWMGTGEFEQKETKVTEGRRRHDSLREPAESGHRCSKEGRGGLSRRAQGTRREGEILDRIDGMDRIGTEEFEQPPSWNIFTTARQGRERRRDPWVMVIQMGGLGG